VLPENFPVSSYSFNLIQLVFSPSVAGVKCGSEIYLHHRVVKCFLSSGIMDCKLFTIEKRSNNALEASVMWHLSFGTIDELL